MNKNILDGRWFQVTCEQEHRNLLMYGDTKNCEMMSCARVQIGKYEGPGKYMLLCYMERCPRNCCYDDVNEVLTADEAIYEIKDKMTDLANLLKIARS